jgi:hypothetical protein
MLLLLLLLQHPFCYKPRQLLNTACSLRSAAAHCVLLCCAAG